MLLAIEANGARARAGVIVYAVGLCAMLAVSTTYHRWVHTLRARAAWRRADHATIFAAIAGTFSAVALAILGTAAAIALLLAGGAAYTVGAVGFGRRWPTLRPATFSYHEVWHAFTIVAAALHLAAVWTVAA